MTTTLTFPGASSAVEVMQIGYTADVDSRHQVHQIISGNASADQGSTVHATLRPGFSRTGTLEIFCADLTDALTLVLLHTSAITGPVRLDDTELPLLGMWYAATGRTSMAPDPQVPARWIVRVDYTEVPAP